MFESNEHTGALSTSSVPVIDAKQLTAPHTLRAIDAACRDWGFFQVVGHGIAHEVIDALHQQMRAFFAQPREEKLRVERGETNPWGYYDRELTKNTPDWKQVFDCGRPDDPRHATPWPQAPTDFRTATQDFAQACEQLALALLSAISTNLGMPANHLRAGFAPRNSSFLRLNHYPPCPTPANPSTADAPVEGYLGVNHHTDAGALTLLLQDDQPGLEVYRGGRWHLVEPRADAIVINIGDIVQVWSNDRYQAALHRVRASTEHPRFSAPYFLNPTYESAYAPLPTTIDAAHPPRYRSIEWGEFRALRAAGDYADCGAEVQIDDYRIDRDRNPVPSNQEHIQDGVH
jgi:isopenicillin N synthase-like dioxygenase